MAQLPVLTPSIVPNYSGGTNAPAPASAFTAVDVQLQRSGYQAQQVADNVIQRHLQLQAQTDDAAATEKGLEYRSRKRHYLLDPTVDPGTLQQGGALFKSGKYAAGITDKADKDLSALADQMAGELANPRQQALFHHAIGLDLESSLNQVAEHEASSTDKFFADTSKAVVEASIEDAVAAAGDPKKQQIYMQRIDDMIRMNVAGLPPEAVDFQVKSAISKVYANTTEALAYRDPTAAMKYLSANQDEVLGSDRLQLERAIDTGLRSKMAAQDHALIMQDKIQKKVADAKAKEGDELLAGGGMTMDWIHQNRAILDESDLRYFYGKMTTDKPEARDDPMTLGDLTSRHEKGEDVEPDARAAMQNGHLSTSSYKQLAQAQSSLPLPLRQAQAQLKAVTAYSELNPTPGSAAAYGNANLDLMEWWNDSGGRLPPERQERAALEAATGIGNRYRVTDLNAQRFTLRFPRSMSGTLGDPAPKLAQNLSIGIDKFNQTQAGMSEEERLDEADRLEKMRINLEAAGVIVPPPPSVQAKRAAAPRPTTGPVPGVPGATLGGSGTSVYGAIPGPTGPLVIPEPSAEAPTAAPGGF